MYNNPINIKMENDEQKVLICEGVKIISEDNIHNSINNQKQCLTVISDSIDEASLSSLSDIDRPHCHL